MNPAYKACKMTNAGTLLLPAGRLSYPALFKARSMPDESEDKAKFSTALLKPPDVDLSLAVKMVEKVASDKWGTNIGKVKRPFLKHAEKTEDAELAAAFPFLVRCSSLTKPTVVFASGDPCTTQEEVYPGRWARVSVRAYSWEHVANGRGVSFGLGNVQLLDHDDRIGGGRAKPEDEFEFVNEAVTGGNASNPDSLFN
jgi:hypothetical protein